MNWAEKLPELLDTSLLADWEKLTGFVDSLYEVDRLWNKGFGNWVVEYKYRRGGKTLCTLYARAGEAVLLVTLGKAERDKFDAQREEFAPAIRQIYDDTASLHDGKWLWIPINDQLSMDDVARLLKIKRRPNRK